MTTAISVRELEHPLPPQETLPTMYDLPSEELGQLGMPDLFHEWQARLLSETFQPPGFAREEIFTASDLNLYYDEQGKSRSRCKRPDWFAVVGLPKEKYPGMRFSYVVWDEAVIPLIVAELLSPSTQRSDLGQAPRDEDNSPTKWDVYEKWLRIPYYVTFSRYTDEVRSFRLKNQRYEEVALENGMLWVAEAQLGLGLWRGRYLGEERLWLRWRDRAGNWIPTPAERAEQERARAEQEHTRAEQEHARAEQERLAKEAAQQRAQLLAAKLRELGIDPDQL
ncbi:MAG: Uma2 family endonuclease [Acidobacteria bacterium]|nr:Uma2 family endonuclease [Acidobacteriota bacterium]MBI3424185.1 Uma2 family endonuclease [Acidobacteriota bacterium]